MSRFACVLYLCCAAVPSLLRAKEATMEVPSWVNGAPTDGVRFHNLAPFAQHGFGSMLKWAFDREPGVWVDRTSVPPSSAPTRRVGRGELRVTFVGHATVLVQLDGLNILTDPVFAERIGPLPWLGPSRMGAVGLRFEDLPPIDAVVISHNHYDHLDLPTLERLAIAHHPRFLIGKKSAGLLEDAGLGDVVELDWGQSLSLSPDVHVTGLPAQHWSKRGLADDFQMLWLGYLLTGSAASVYFAGDTGWGPHFQQISDHVGPPTVALLPIGAFRPRWLMHQAHLSPTEAADAALVMRAGVMIPIHYGAFRLGDDGQDEPLAVLQEYLQTPGNSKPKVVILEPGDAYVPPSAPNLAGNGGPG